MRVTRKILIVAVVPLVPLILVIQAHHCFMWSLIKPTWNFRAVENDAHVLYEPGMQTFADEIARQLPDSRATVEREQLRTFKGPVFIYVCGTPQSFNEFTMRKGAMAVSVSPEKIFVSPMLANKAITQRPGYLTHELSHAHLQQYTGLVAFRLSPNWFKEGLAVLVSDGAGADLVRDEEAIEFIRSGRTFAPTEDGSDVSELVSPPFSDLEPFPKPLHMLYREWMLFVSYLKQEDPHKFKQLLERFESSGNFRDSFAKTYGQSIQSVFSEFVDDLKNK